MPLWPDSWDEDTVDAAYGESLRVQELQSQWSDAMDSKAVAVFTVASVIVTLLPALEQLERSGPVLGLWMSAGWRWS
jgi:hypothetical protein